MINLKERWRQYYTRYIGARKYFYLNSQTYSMYKNISPVINKNVSGRTMDLGAGEMTYRELLKKQVSEYVSVDKYKCHPDIDVVADINNLPFKNEDFDTVFCSQVFEHIRQPWVAIKEISRVLKKGGTVILTVPHLSYLHGEPEDFYRYTKYGIEQIAFEGGLFVKKIIPCGGLFGFIYTPISIVMLSIFGNIKIIGEIAFYLNFLFIRVVDIADNFFDKNNIYCYNYIAILVKKDE